MAARLAGKKDCYLAALKAVPKVAKKAQPLAVQWAVGSAEKMGLKLADD